MFKSSYVNRVVAVLLLLMIAGCTSEIFYKETKKDVTATERKLYAARDQNEVPAPPVVSKSEPYVDVKPISMTRRPAWLKDRINVHGEQLPFALYASKILSSGDYTPRFQSSFDRHGLISLNYRGTVEGALDHIVAKTNTVYELDHKHKTITFKNMITRTFNVSFMPGSTDALLGRSSSGGDAGGGGTAVVSAQSSSDEFSKIEAKTDLWGDLDAAVKNLLSSDGKAVVSQATTTVTVTDHVDNINAVKTYLKQLNENLSLQVLLKVVVLDIELNKSYAYGINWTMIREQIGKRFNLNGDFTSILRSIGTDDPAAGLTITKTTGQRSLGTTVLIQALEQQAHVAVVTRPQVITLNNQVASISITDQTAYLASVSNTVEEGTVTTSLEPGIVQSGFSLFVLPKIQGNKVYLSITTSLSTLDAIQVFDSGTGVTTGAGGTSPAIRIQTPELSEKYFNQRNMLHTGDTLVLTGFKQVGGRHGKAANFGSDALGGKGAEGSQVETILLITPYILGGDHNPHVLTEQDVRDEYTKEENV